MNSCVTSLSMTCPQCGHPVFGRFVLLEHVPDGEGLEIWCALCARVWDTWERHREADGAVSYHHIVPRSTPTTKQTYRESKNYSAFPVQVSSTVSTPQGATLSATSTRRKR